MFLLTSYIWAHNTVLKYIDTILLICVQIVEGKDHKILSQHWAPVMPNGYKGRRWKPDNPIKPEVEHYCWCLILMSEKII